MAKKILIVDDEEDLVEIMKCHLADAGYDVVTACDGENCLQVLRKTTPHLIILDILMPKMTGYEVIKKIREIDRLRDIPIIVTTARKDMKTFLDSWDVKDFILKPLNYDDLMDKIKHIFLEMGPPQVDENSKEAEERRTHGKRKAVIAACGDFITHKLKATLEKQGYYTVVATKNSEVFKEMGKYYPIHFIICEMSDATLIDPHEIYQHLHGKPSESVRNAFFLIFCEEELAGKALKYFLPNEILVYESGEELLCKFEEYIKQIDRRAA